MYHPVSAFDECYPPEIVGWINTFPAPDQMAEQQLHIARIIDDPRTIAAAQNYFSMLNECDTADDGNAMIARFQAMLEDLAKPENLVPLFIGRLATLQ